jgi:hypothetical protein
MTSRETRLMRVSRELMGIWRSQGRQGDGTPKGRETRNVTIDLQREFTVFGGQVFAPGNVYLRHTPTSPRIGAKCQNKSGSKHLLTAEK